MPAHSSTLRKRRTREHVIADLSVNFVERQVLLCGFIAERTIHDYGLDLILWTFAPSGEVEPGAVYLQVKATDRVTIVGRNQFISLRIERRDLRAWLVQPFPVILILYDAANDQAYWLYVQAEFSGVKRFRAARGSETLKIRIPLSNILDSNAIRRFQAYRNKVLAQSDGVTYHHV